MKRPLRPEEEFRLLRDSNPGPHDPKAGALTARPRGRFRLCRTWSETQIVDFVT